MQDKGINSTFKKIIYESSEMVFLADDIYPYPIFYGNESFENLIGENLNERSLVGLGLDVNTFVFKEELVLSHNKKDFSFKLELSQDSGSNYFLFYKGKELKNHGLPSRKETFQFFTSKLDLIAVGKSDRLTFLNPAVLPVLGYEMVELIDTNLCPFIHKDDLNIIQEIWGSDQINQEVTFFEMRFLGKDGEYRNLECSVQFYPETFFVIARDVSYRIKSQKNDLKLSVLLDKSTELNKSGNWKVDLETGELILEHASEKILAELMGGEYRKGTTESLFLDQVREAVASLDPQQNEFEGILKLSKSQKLGFSAFFDGKSRSEVRGIIWDDSQHVAIKNELEMHRELWLDSPEAMMIVESDGKVFLANKEVNELFGLERNNRISHLNDLNVYFEESNPWSEWVSAATSDSSVSRFSTLLINKKGKQLTLEIASRKTVLNEINYTNISFRDISEKINLEKKVEASSDFFMNLTEQVPGGLFQLVLNSEGQMHFSFLSKGINSVLGLSKDEIHQFTDISTAISKVHPQDLPMVIMSSVASSRKMEPWQCQFRVKSGSNNQDYRWVLGAARPQASASGGGDMLWYGYLTDISNQKVFEAKLNEARLAAEKANQIKSDFLSMISHELRTPLNAISGSVYSLFQEDPTENQKAALNTINFAVDNLIIMINDLLDFQKIEAGKLTIEHNPFNLKILLEQVIKGLSFHAKDSKNNLELHLSEGLDITIKGDKTRLSQVLNNLITNALKFTHEGNVDVKIELLGQIRNKIRVNFTVQDDGIGIAPENQHKIFDDFDQVKPTFSSKYGGTGLGLSITKKLLTLMGGNISVESELGKGSRFFFELEFDLAQEVKVKTPAHDRLGRSFESLHLLMAEDNEVNALVLGKIIRKWGFSFERVHNGKEALELAQKRNFDCILMDIQMPVMDGFEATVEIKKFSKTPIIALTAAAKLEIMERIEECEFDGFVAKPIDATELLKKVKEVVEEKTYKA